MKKNIYLLMVMMLLVYALVGCAPKDQMTNFIPTQIPEAEDDSNEFDDTEEDSEVTEGEDAEDTEASDDADQPTPIGKTTVKYVKLNEYSDYLNIRTAPSLEGKIAGFLVHAEKVSVIEIVDGWASIVYNEAIHYVKADYLADERPAFLEPPTPTPIPENTPTPIPDENEEPPEI